MTHGWAYVLPRAVIVLVGWGATYFILTAISTQLPTAVIYITGIVWMSAGVLCFGYLYRLRCEMELLPQQRLPAVPPQPPERAVPAPTIVTRLLALPPRRKTAA